jgi:hypothetical protein
MWPERLNAWISDGITVDISEAEVMADLDSWWLTVPDRQLLEEVAP